MKKITPEQAIELAKLLEGWCDNPALPTTPMELKKPIELPNGDFHPTDYAIEPSECVTKADIEQAIAKGLVTLPGGLTPDDLERKMMVGKRVVNAVLTTTTHEVNGVPLTRPSVDFMECTHMEHEAKKEITGLEHGYGRAYDQISNPRQRKTPPKDEK